MPYEAQRAWRARQVAAGRCYVCGAPRSASRRWCDDHLAQRRERARARVACRPWVDGGRGRPPLNRTRKKALNGE